MSIEPINIEQVKFYLIIEGQRVEIAEPTKFDAANFVIKSEDGRMGVDVSFASGTIELQFDRLVNIRGLSHRFEEIIQSYKTKGFESNIEFVIGINQGGSLTDYVIGELDFEEAKTDLTNYFKCKVIQSNNQAILKRRSNVEVDLFSDLDSNNNYIEPLEPVNLFYKATPTRQDSEWVMGFSSQGLDLLNTEILSETVFSFNPYLAIEKSEVQETISPARSVFGQSNLTDFTIIAADNNIDNGTLTISEVSYKFDFFPLNEFPAAAGGLYYYIGSDYQFGDATPLFETGTLNQDNPSFEIVNQTFVVNDITIRKGEYLMLFFYLIARPQNQSYRFSNQVTSGKVSFTGVSTAISSIISVVNLGDAMRQVVKSISGLPIDAPRFEVGGEFENQYITNGKLMRGLTDEPFYISFEKLLEFFPEVKGDYEINDDSVFFGIEEDFHRDVDMGTFLISPNAEFEVDTNPEFAINTFEMEYAKYEQENDVNDSRESAHTKMQLLTPNLRANNNKKVVIGFIRCSFLTETTRKEAFRVDDDVANENDEDIFMLDCKEGQINDVIQKLVLRHEVEDSSVLKILNDGSFNWLLTGMAVNDFIELLEFENIGEWRVIGIETRVLTLLAIGASVANFSGEVLTTLKYNVTTANIINRTNEGFTTIVGTSNEQGFSNMRFTLKRNLLRYYANYLATACMFHPIGTIKMTKYIHNRLLETNYPGELFFRVEEGQDVAVELLDLITNKLMTPYRIKTELIINFPEFWDLRRKIRSERGYINIVQNDGTVIKVFPKDCDFSWQNGTMKVISKQKNEA